MKIQEVLGDITTLPENINVIIHQANINKIMRSGVAKALCDKWPIVAKVDISNTSEKNNVLGTISVAAVEKESFENDPFIYGTKFVINLYGQSLFESSIAGCRTDYNAVIRGFSEIEKMLSEWKEIHEFNPIIGIPKYMGCDLAGGNWEIYYKIITETFKNTDFEIVIVNFGKTINR